MTYSLAQIKALLRESDIRLKGSLGQNFIGDPNTVRKIAHLARLSKCDRVVEIGAGLGSLTLALIETGAIVTAIEIDRRVAELLSASVGSEASVVVADALDIDWDSLLSETDAAVVVANLPYNCGTAIYMDILRRAPKVSRMVLMFQAEVATRIVAAVGDKTYGLLSLATSLYGQARICGHVSKNVFVPVPDVESLLIEFTRSTSDGVDPEKVMELAKRAFGQKRKMLRKSLGGIVADDQFELAEIDPSLRPEEVETQQWIRLTKVVSQ